LGVLRQAEGGMPVAGLCREHGIGSATFFKWRAECGGMDASMMSQMKALPANQAFDALLGQRAAIEVEYGGPLDWQPLPEKTAARIAVHLSDAAIDDRADWRRQHEWITQELARFRKVFANRVRRLRLDEALGADGADLGGDPDEMA
jgi:hypothetical protein